MTSTYAARLEQGQRFQDYATGILYRHGIIALCNSSKSMQLLGESIQGIEIKLDTRWKTTGNIYVEVAEKSDPNNSNYVPSGIYRKDNTWLWVIGDESEVFLFSKRQLQVAHGLKRFKTVETSTSRGFLLPVSDARKFWSVMTIKGGQRGN